ncbi:MAG TPA: tetratricopeptide repeat protein [Kofleriaceae bacterium]|nr:tetratricopeptide repeat protein [Kofleriaceae bacterium]
MPALRKPHRVAFLVPAVRVEGADVAFAHEAALLLWTACIEVCQRHPGLAVYDAESTPMVPLEAHFTPQHAVIGATPSDAFYGPTRRDELMWLELSLPGPGPVRLHVLARDGQRASFDAIGKNLGEQIHQVLGAWLSARGLAPLPKRFDAVTAEELLVVVRVIAPALIEQARAWVLPTAPSWTLAEPDDTADVTREQVDAFDDDAPPPRERAATEPSGATASAALPRSNLARPVANRVPAGALRLAALRLIELALREDLDELILAIDPDQPQALFARFQAWPEMALLRRVIAAAPCWARPYAELVRRGAADEPGAPTELESVAGAGIAALCRPGQLDVLERVSALLEESGLVDEGARLLERALAIHDEDSRAHITLVDRLGRTGREGAALVQALRASRVHGCPMDPQYPWYPDQIQVDLLVADAMLRVGRLDEAIALRANRLAGRETGWPRHARILAAWRKDARFVAWSYAREGAFRGDPARAVEGFGRIEPASDVDVATFVDALVATGREDEVALAWAQFGLGASHTGPIARLAAARALLAAGEWQRGLEELWRVELTEPGRDEHVAIAHCGLLLSCAPIDTVEAVLGERVVVGAATLVRRMARDIADFVPTAAASSVVSRALGKLSTVDFDPSSALAGFAADTPSRKAIDALFAELGPLTGDDALARADRLVNRWLDVVFTEASEQHELARAAAYAAAQAVGRYLAATTAKPSPIAGGLRTVAAEALALVRAHRHALDDREARAMFGALEGMLRRVDRWIGSTWLGAVERACGLDERAGGAVAGFVRDHATVAARVLGPEETAVLAASIARLHRERPARWAAAVDAQATQLALHTGYLGADEWADATVALLAAKELEPDDAIDALQTACYLVEGISAGPAFHLARVLLDAGRGPAAAVALLAGLSAATPAQRERELPTLAAGWKRLELDLPLAFAEVATQMFSALQQGDPARAEKLGRWAVALDPTNGEAYRNLGLALAQQGKTADALAHLARSTREQATQILAGVLDQRGKLPEAMAVLDYASRWYVRAEQWLTYGGIAYAAMDSSRTVHAYGSAYHLDREAFDVTQLNAYAGVLDEVGDYATCETIANHLLRLAGDDLTWKTNGWNHLACAYLGLGKLAEAEQLARDAVKHNPLAENAAAFQATLDRVVAKAPPTPTPLTRVGRAREPVFALLDASDHSAASEHARDPSWRVRRAALEATRFRFASENAVEVGPRARAAARAVLDDSVGLVDLAAMSCRALALRIREQAFFARDPVPPLGDRMTRDAFYQEFRARGGVVLGEPTPPPPAFVDRVVVAGSKVARASDYVALLRDLAALTPREALAQFDLDEAGYLEVAVAWAAALAADSTLAGLISAGLAKR